MLYVIRIGLQNVVVLPCVGPSNSKSNNPLSPLQLLLKMCGTNAAFKDCIPVPMLAMFCD